jgi:hypothetical protein
MRADKFINAVAGIRFLEVLVAVLTAWVENNNLKGKKVLEFTCGGACKDILTGLGCVYHETMPAY